MEMNERVSSTKEHCPETPSLIKFIAANEVVGFDNIEGQNGLKDRPEPTEIQSFSPPHLGVERMHSVSISMPPSPLEAHVPNTRRVFFRDHHDDSIIGTNVESTTARSGPQNSKKSKQAKFYSQPMPRGAIFDEGVASENLQNHHRNPRIDKLKDKRFDSFKTWSGKLERQLTLGRNKNTSDESNALPKAEMETVPVDRYYDALEGPELDTLRPSEEILLPEDKKWPFLLRFPVSSFGICLGVSSQAIMWKNLATSDSTKFLHISLDVNLVLWCISVALVAIVALIYALKVIFYFEAVRREYYHPIRVNFFFAPWIALLFLAIGVPPSVTKSLPHALWYVLMTPFLFLELKIYGQWMSGGQRRLSKVANPSNHLSLVGNFVGALLGASMGLKEGPIFFFAVGFAHYIVLFVTLYQRLPTNETLPKELHPVFFLFVAAPSVASMAWANINGSFDYGSRIAYFIGMFLYFSLAVRINFFRGFRFSLAWWAYTFPMTGAAIATIRYSTVVTNTFTKCVAVGLSAIATLTVAALLITTILHAFVLRDLFPNDISIAISESKPHKSFLKHSHRRHGSSDKKDTEYYLQYLNSDGKDIEAALAPLSSTNQENVDSSKKEAQININQSAAPSSTF